MPLLLMLAFFAASGFAALISETESAVAGQLSPPAKTLIAQDRGSRGAPPERELPPGAGLLHDPELNRYICYQGPLDRSPANNESFFSKTRSLRVEFQNASPAESRLLSAMVRKALRVWSAACRNCGADTMAVLAFGDEIWIDKTFLGALRSSMRLDPIPPNVSLNDRLTYGEFEAKLRRSNARGEFGEFSDYERLSPNDPAKKRLCDWPKATISPLFAPIQTALCDQSPFTYLIVLRDDGATACPAPDTGSQDIIACTTPAESRVELNTRDHLMRGLPSDGSAAVGSLGSPPCDLFSVILHETGHWIGLDDNASSVKTNIMHFVLEPNACINADNFVELKNNRYMRDNESHGFGVKAPSALLARKRE